MANLGRSCAASLVLAMVSTTTVAGQPSAGAAQPQADPEASDTVTERRAPSEDTDRPIEEHVPGKGATLAKGGMGELVFSLYATIRYLNQRALDSTSTDEAGTTTTIDRRDDLQFQKVLIYFKGWLGVPALRYLTYVWTSNTSQGLPSQVVVAGNFSYTVNDYLKVGAGIGSLPTTRTTLGNFPAWLKQDSRTIADEYFRGSYTSGVWIWGDLPARIHYRVMIGNNLSQLGIDAGQLDMGMETYSGAAWWTSKGFGAYEGFGDLKRRAEPAASAGVAFTHSREDRQNQPDTEAPDNAQLRISDGRLIFAPDVFAPGVQLTRATYRMASAHGAVKYRGFALEAELFYRWLGDFEADEPIPIDELRDHGAQIQASAMLTPTLMLYGAGSMIFGQHGDPWDLGIGLNYFPFENRVVRVNGEAIFVDESPVGNLSSPLLVGADGVVFVTNVEVYF